jgi:RNA polymerase sigma factor (sigma-70 family)
MNIDVDLPLVQRVKDGDQKAFAQLVAIHKTRILGLIVKMVRNLEDAQDLSQETLVKAYRRLKDFKGESSFKTWLTKIAINLCINFNRKRNLTALVHSGIIVRSSFGGGIPEST